MQKTIPLISKEINLGFTGDSVRQYIEDKPLQKGDLMVIASSFGGMWQYQLATVEEAASGKQKRVILSHAPAYGGKSFYRTGKNCFSPKGQSMMIPPTHLVLQYIQTSGDIAVCKALYGIE